MEIAFLMKTNVLLYLFNLTVYYVQKHGKEKGENSCLFFLKWFIIKGLDS